MVTTPFSPRIFIAGGDPDGLRIVTSPTGLARFWGSRVRETTSQRTFSAGGAHD